MKRSSFIILTLMFSLAVCATSLKANVPPPPANQIIGINDGVFNDLTEADCRLCHENPDQYPVEDETLSNRHHLLYDTVIPDPTDAPYGTPGDSYQCLSCHETVNTGSGFQFLIESNCLICHIQSSSSELTVHHRTDLATGNLPQGPDCVACHGSLVNNMQDGHFIPTYDPSPRTPKPSDGNGLPLNSEGNGTGACDYCHATGTGDDSIPGTDDATGIMVYSSRDTHHETGFGGDGGTQGFFCDWCHDQTEPYEEPMRICENCHGPDSLHNIQVDSNGDALISPGIELAGYGHIGNPEDCWGCHGFGASSDPYQSSSIIPYINTISKSVITAGAPDSLLIGGSAFTNVNGGTVVTSTITLSADGIPSIEIIPDAINENTIAFVIPGTLSIGNYTLRARKTDKMSNPVTISITPLVQINDSICDQQTGIVTVTGTGFGDTPPVGSDDHLNIKLGGVPLEIISWSDSLIQASAPSCIGVTTVNALYASATLCSCEGNFDGDSDVDGTDVVVFKTDFGRNALRTPCTTSLLCNGDFDCDGDVDGSDASIIKQDFGRSVLGNSCNACMVEQWCNYQ